MGEFIGESSFINKQRKSASAKAVEDSIILCIDQDALRGYPASLKINAKMLLLKGWQVELFI